MELQTLKNHLSEAQELLKKYSDYQAEIETERYKILIFNRNTLFLILGLLAGYIIYTVGHRLSEPFSKSVLSGLISFAIGIVGMRWVIGPILDRQKINQMKADTLRRFQPKLQEMDAIALKLETSGVIPEKYRTYHAVSHILEYIKNFRADSLKEGLNLYEEEMSRNKQSGQFDQIIGQNRKMINQNIQIIQNQKSMIRAQRTTNYMLLFK